MEMLCCHRNYSIFVYVIIDTQEYQVISNIMVKYLDKE